MTNRKTNQVEAKAALRELREAVGLTQEQLAFHMKKSSSTIRRWEKGEEPTLTHVEWQTLCKLLKKSFDELPSHLSKPLPDSTSEHPQVTE